mgnify:CR=1 FL=1
MSLQPAPLPEERNIIEFSLDRLVNLNPELTVKRHRLRNPVIIKIHPTRHQPPIREADCIRDDAPELAASGIAWKIVFVTIQPSHQDRILDADQATVDPIGVEGAAPG